VGFGCIDVNGCFDAKRCHCAIYSLDGETAAGVEN
jgi:hypothetical protein